MEKHYSRILLAAILAMALVACASQQAPTTSVFQPERIDMGGYAPKVDAFMVILDASMSMSDRYQGKEKFVIAKDLLSAMNLTIPDIDLKSGIRTYGRSKGESDRTILVYGISPHDKSDFERELRAAGRGFEGSRAELAFSAATRDLAGKARNIAVVMISDGKIDPDAAGDAIQTLRNTVNGNVCIYPVLIGNDPAGAATMAKIAEAGGCGASFTAEQIASSAAMAGFVKTALLAKAAPKPVPMAAPTAPMDSDGDGVFDDDDDCPDTPVGARVDITGCWALRGTDVEFDFDKWEIKPAAYPFLNEALVIMNRNPGMKVEIQGHTDSSGPAEYNKMLSEKRAQRVMAYFVDNGVDSKRLRAVGLGESRPITNNDTPEGRSQNRRVRLKRLP
ncbi:hypothetical protein D3OALGA1CA_2475 [Olavius algarvensis associated proteobacterium Delta 3]|nr:hypothetical protein D3OALGA1CA_2475 [Olavius algarvensis associated proteobacterium Delta 3]CAB5154824.1 hypothetical protein D3OALGB2SA_5033 [Olavius algarvensis associated proteobacterium Delta 3]